MPDWSVRHAVYGVDEFGQDFQCRERPLFTLAEPPFSNSRKLDGSVFTAWRSTIPSSWTSGALHRSSARRRVRAERLRAPPLRRAFGAFFALVGCFDLYTEDFEISTSRCWSSCPLNAGLGLRACRFRSSTSSDKFSDFEFGPISPLLSHQFRFHEKLDGAAFPRGGTRDVRHGHWESRVAHVRLVGGRAIQRGLVASSVPRCDGAECSCTCSAWHSLPRPVWRGW